MHFNCEVHLFYINYLVFMSIPFSLSFLSLYMPSSVYIVENKGTKSIMPMIPKSAPPTVIATITNIAGKPTLLPTILG